MMDTVSFDYIWLLPLAVLLPVATVWLLRRADRRRRERLSRLGETGIVERLLPPNAFSETTRNVYCVCGERISSVIVCEVTRVESSTEPSSYAGVSPKSTRLVAD